MSGGYADIAGVLQGARRRQARIILLAASAGGLAVALSCVLAGAGALLAGARPGFRAVALAGAVIGFGWALGAAVLALVRGSRDERAVVRALAARDPGLRSALLSSVELARERAAIEADRRYSVALVDRHLALTADRARALDLRSAIPDRRARVAGRWLLAVAGAYALAFLVGGGTFGRAVARVLAGEPAGAPPAQIDPITGDVELTYRYPAYMKRDPRTLSGTGGEIRAPKGTEVTLRTRADRPVKAAELVVELEAEGAPAPVGADASAPAPAGTLAPPERAGPGAERDVREKGAEPKRTPITRLALTVGGERELSGRLLVQEGGSYRFRFLDGKGRGVAEGPPIPIALEPDQWPEVRVTAPERELEVNPDEVVAIDWQAEDDFGVAEVTLVLRLPGGEEERRILRKAGGLRRDGGTHDLALAPLHLAEGDRLSFFVEAADTDVVSGPKKASSETRVVKIYSEAEHRRQVMAQAKQLYEELVALLGDRLDVFAQGPVTTADRLPVAQALDARTRTLHESMRNVARDIRRDPAGPREVSQALLNVAGGLRVAEQRLTAARQPVAQALRVRIRIEPSLARAMAAYDDALDRELEKGILYLEQLLDKRRAEDLLQLAKDLARKRRDLAGLLERFRQSPSEQAKKELVAQIQRMKERVRDLLARMAEMSRGFNDEHMNREALAEMQKSQDLMGGLDEVEKKLAQGDLEGAMKALDQMAGAMDQMLAGLQRTAGLPDEKNQALMKEMLAFKDDLEKVQREQQAAAAETEKVRAEYRKRIADRMKGAEEEVRRLGKLAEQARKDVEGAQPGVSMRSEPEYDLARESLKDLERALSMRELEGANEAAQRAQSPVDRLAMMLEEDAALGERGFPFQTGKDPRQAAEAHQKVSQAVPKVREIREKLARLFPDPRSVLDKEEQRRLGELAKRQGELERKAGELQQKLGQLAEKAPIFPPSAQGQLSEGRGHMGQAAHELGARNPQRGHGEQELALDALARFKKGLEDAARQSGQGGSGQGFPFPFAESGGERMGEGGDPSREKVKIPGAEAHKAPEEFRKDLLEAMKQGAPERYKGEVQRYYEELVK